MPFALLPPMPLGPRLVLGLSGTLFAGLLNLVFRNARVRRDQWAVAFVLSPTVVLAATGLGLSSGQRTEYVFCGAVVGVLCVRGDPRAGAIPSFFGRAAVVLIAFAALGPVVGLAIHYLRYRAGVVRLDDEREIQLSLEDGVTASVVGCLLGGIMVLASVGWCSEGPRSPGGSPPSPGTSAEPGDAAGPAGR